MSRYIPADKLIAEINNRLMSVNLEELGNFGCHRVWAYNDVKDLIASLQQEQPDGLGEAANMYGLKSAHGEDNYCAWWHRDGFKSGAEWMAGQFEKNRLEALSKVKALRDAQNMHAKTLNYGYRCLAIRLGKEVDEMLDKLKIK